MRQVRRILAGAAAAVALATVASADPAGRGFGRHGPPPIDHVLERHAEELALGAEVLERVRKLAAEGEEQAKPLRDALAAEREAMHGLLAQDVPDAEAVMLQADLVGAAETEVRKQRLRTLLAVRALLTPEQRRGMVRIFEEKRHRIDRHGPPDAPELP